MISEKNQESPNTRVNQSYTQPGITETRRLQQQEPYPAQFSSTLDYTASPSSNYEPNGIYNSGLGRSSRRSVRVSQTGSIGHTPGINRSPKRVIAAEEARSAERGFSPSPDKPSNEIVTVYERDPVLVSVNRPDEIPSINIISPNKTTVTPVITSSRIEPIEAHTERLISSPRAYVQQSPTIVRESIVASPLGVNAPVDDEYFPNGTPNLFRHISEPVEVVQPVTTTAVIHQPVTTTVVQSHVTVPSPSRVVSSPRTTINPTRISKGDPYEVGRTYLGMGSPSRSYTVVDDSDRKVYTTSPTKATTADQLLREGYSPSVMNLTADPNTTITAPVTTQRVSHTTTAPAYTTTSISTNIVHHSPVRTSHVTTTPTYTSTIPTTVVQQSPVRVSHTTTTPAYTTTVPTTTVVQRSPSRVSYGHPVNTQVYAAPVMATQPVYSTPVQAQAYVPQVVQRSPARAYGAPGPTLSIQHGVVGGSPYRYEAVSPQIASNYSPTVTTNAVAYSNPITTSVYN